MNRSINCVKSARNLKLNAGCGRKSWGDIRVDVERYSNIYLSKTSANVIADVCFLPFKECSFSECRCFHVLEHVDDPRLALSELRRVSEKVVLRFPVWHLYSFMIEVLGLLLIFVFRPTFFYSGFTKIRRWKERYGTHKWYLHFKNAKINSIFGIPKEYEVTLYS